MFPRRRAERRLGDTGTRKKIAYRTAVPGRRKCGASLIGSRTPESESKSYPCCSRDSE
uniref:Uncharacterized protein n=1 Tax=Cercocebus atys TaxID=9531 RepID=A0A2K5P8A2_CERAT